MYQKLDSFMTNLLGRSWKTTIAGFIGAVAILISQGLSARSAVLAAVVQTFGALAKDATAHSTVDEVRGSTVKDIDQGKPVSETAAVVAAPSLPVTAAAMVTPVAVVIPEPPASASVTNIKR